MPRAPKLAGPEKKEETAAPLAPWLRPAKRRSPAVTASYWRLLREQCPVDDADQDELLDAKARAGQARYIRNIENYVGTVSVPVGVVGPLRIDGDYAQGDYYVPLATTEAALVASYGRGARLISLAGGCETVLVAEAVQRAPAFAFASLRDAVQLLGLVRRQLRRAEGRRRRDHVARQAAGDRSGDRGRSRLSRLQLHHGRCRRPEHGHVRDPSAVRAGVCAIAR